MTFRTLDRIWREAQEKREMEEIAMCKDNSIESQVANLYLRLREEDRPETLQLRIELLGYVERMGKKKAAIKLPHHWEEK